MYILAILSMILFLGLVILFIYDRTQTKHSILRNFPIIGRLRWAFEAHRDKVRQYFNESDTDGTPFNRNQRALIYRRSKNVDDNVPFGTQIKSNLVFANSMFPRSYNEVEDLRVTVGSKYCDNKYSASIMNISAMSYGALSGAAIKALNLGALSGRFYHNTGEGGISEFHNMGADIVYQIGTGYFGCGVTDNNGNRRFSETQFTNTIGRYSNVIKMIEIKISQGAKAGKGGVLPAKKNTQNIANTRGILANVTVNSPSYHSEFSDNNEMILFLMKIRSLMRDTLGYTIPLGIKFCVGNMKEVDELFKTFSETGIYPDFITIDGAEGGTGSAPQEFTDHVGIFLRDALPEVIKIRRKYKLTNEVTVIASGKIYDAATILEALHMGADLVNMARPFMLSLGCIQARECNMDTCPVGIATQNKRLERGLVVEDKWERVYNFHKNTIKAVKELLAATGATTIEQFRKNRNSLVK